MALDPDPYRILELPPGATLDEVKRAYRRHLDMAEELPSVLEKYADDAIEEISEAAGMPVGTAKCYAHRGRNRLRDKLSDVA